MFEHVEIVARKWNWPRLPLISCPLPQEFADRTAWYFRYSDTHRESLWDRHVGWHSIVLRNSRLLRQKASTDNSPPARTVCWFISWTEDEEEEIIFSNIVNKEQGVRRKIISFTLYTIVKKKMSILLAIQNIEENVRKREVISDLLSSLIPENVLRWCSVQVVGLLKMLIYRVGLNLFATASYSHWIEEPRRAPNKPKSYFRHHLEFYSYTASFVLLSKFIR